MTAAYPATETREQIEATPRAFALPCSLIGLPGCGKSAIGREVALRLGVPFIDIDRCIEEGAGRTIVSLFKNEGEAAFRDREIAALAAAVEARSAVIATGGGVILRAANRELLRVRTTCVFLHAGHDLLWKRLRRDRRRPLLQVADAETRLRQMNEEREPLYRETAAIVVDIDGQPFERVVSDVVGRLTSGARR